MMGKKENEISIRTLIETTKFYTASLESELHTKKIYDLRVLIPMGELIKLVLTCQKNYYLSERINQLFIFFRHKFGTAYGNRFLLAFAKEILLKT